MYQDLTNALTMSTNGDIYSSSDSLTRLSEPKPVGLWHHLQLIINSFMPEVL